MEFDIIIPTIQKIEYIKENTEIIKTPVLIKTYEVVNDNNANRIAWYKLIGMSIFAFVFFPKIVLYIWAFESIGIVLFSIIYLIIGDKYVFK